MESVFSTFNETDTSYYFTFRTTNGRRIFTSKPYRYRSLCYNGIDAIKQCVDMDECFHRKTSGDKFYFIFVSPHNEVIGSSINFETEVDRDNGVAQIKREANSSEISDVFTANRV